MCVSAVHFACTIYFVPLSKTQLHDSSNLDGVMLSTDRLSLLAQSDLVSKFVTPHFRKHQEGFYPSYSVHLLLTL